MNQAEIMTLLSAKVKEPQIRVAIMAGKLSGILNAADRTIDRAKQFHDGADWTEILRILEGKLDGQTDHAAEDGKRTTQKKHREY